MDEAIAFWKMLMGHDSKMNFNLFGKIVLAPVVGILTLILLIFNILFVKTK